MDLSSPFSLYLHIPFCVHRCAYCDFNTYAGLEALIEPYTQAICRELDFAGGGRHLEIHTVFFGGGTPSLLPITSLAAIQEAIQRRHTLTANAEITIEANPGTLSPNFLREAHRLGINRLSLGMQSAHPNDLRILERQHNLQDVVQSVKWARQAGFDNINLDLIYGLPYQTLTSWQGTLAMALSLLADHLSLYSLTVEHGTPLSRWLGRGLLPVQDEDLAADMYETATETLEKHGYEQYEISNWASRATDGSLKTCRHNLQYWRSLPWLGAGAGAHGFVPLPEQGTFARTVNVLAPGQYIERMRQSTALEFPRTPATSGLTIVQKDEFIGEFMMMGLRLTSEGISERDFSSRFGVSLEERFAREIQRLSKLGLLEWRPGRRLCLTKNGRLLGNRVFREFI